MQHVSGYSIYQLRCLGLHMDVLGCCTGHFVASKGENYDYCWRMIFIYRMIMLSSHMGVPGGVEEGKQFRGKRHIGKRLIGKAH